MIVGTISGQMQGTVRGILLSKRACVSAFYVPSNGRPGNPSQNPPILGAFLLPLNPIARHLSRTLQNRPQNTFENLLRTFLQLHAVA